jgi:tetratricopeptide (TPR) repeat protein
MSYHIFISYARKDNADGKISKFVENLKSVYKALTGEKLEVFFDTDKIQPGQDWEKRLYESLNQSSSMIALLSPSYLKSEYCLKEWHIFDSHSAIKRVVDDGIRPLVIVQSEDFQRELQKFSPQIQKQFNRIQRKTLSINEFIDDLTESYIQNRIADLKHEFTNDDSKDSNLGTLGIELIDSTKWIRLLSQRNELAKSSKSFGALKAINQGFVGRVEELRAIRTAFAKSTQVAVSAEGIAGVGKTELATAYAHAFAWDYPAGRWFIPCEGKANLSELLAEQMSIPLGIELPSQNDEEIVQHAGLTLKDLDSLFSEDDQDTNENIMVQNERQHTIQGFERIRNHLNSLPSDKRKVLVVLDNVDKEDLVSTEAIRELNVDQTNFDILITSRNRLRAGIEGDEYLRIINVSRLDDEELLDILGVTSTTSSDDRTAARELIQETDGHTLALAIAGAHFRRNGVSISEYFRDIKDNIIETLDDTMALPNVAGEITHQQKVIGSIFRKSITKLSDTQQVILCYAACCHPDFVPSEWLEQLASNEFPALSKRIAGDTKFKYDLKELVNASLLTPPQGSNGLYKIHRLVAGTIKQLPIWSTDRPKKIKELLEQLFTSENEDLNPNLLTQAVAPLLLSLPCESADDFLLLQKTGSALSHKGYREEAEPCFQRVLNTGLTTLGEDHTIILRCQNGIAICLYKKGDFEEAEKLFRQVFEASERIRGPEHLGTLGSLSNLANCLYKKGDLAEAEKLKRQVLEAREPILGPDDPDTISSLGNLANFLYKKGDLVEAEKLYRQVFETRERTRGLENRITLETLENLAICLEKKRDLVEAEKLYRQVFEARERILGPEHHHTLYTLSSLSRLAYCLDKKGDLEEAEKLYRQVFEARERILGPDDPDTISSLGNLANCLYKKGDLVEAERLFRQVLETSERTQGPEHYATLGYLSKLANFLDKKGDLVEAERLFRQFLETSERTQGPEHYATLEYLSKLAIFLDKKGDLVEAERLFRQVFEVRERTQGPDDPDTISSLGNLANFLYKKGDLVEAEKLYRQVFETRERILGPEHKDTKSTAQAIQKVQESITQVEDYNGKMDCPRCQGTGFVTMQDIVRLEMVGKWQPGVCRLCSGQEE